MAKFEDLDKDTLQIVLQKLSSHDLKSLARAGRFFLEPVQHLLYGEVVVLKSRPLRPSQNLVKHLVPTKKVTYFRPYDQRIEPSRGQFVTSLLDHIDNFDDATVRGPPLPELIRSLSIVLTENRAQLCERIIEALKKMKKLEKLDVKFLTRNNQPNVGYILKRQPIVKLEQLKELSVEIRAGGFNSKHANFFGNLIRYSSITKLSIVQQSRHFPGLKFATLVNEFFNASYPKLTELILLYTFPILKVTPWFRLQRLEVHVESLRGDGKSLLPSNADIKRLPQTLTYLSLRFSNDAVNVGWVQFEQEEIQEPIKGRVGLRPVKEKQLYLHEEGDLEDKYDYIDLRTGEPAMGCDYWHDKRLYFKPAPGSYGRWIEPVDWTFATQIANWKRFWLRRLQGVELVRDIGARYPCPDYSREVEPGPAALPWKFTSSHNSRQPLPELENLGIELNMSAWVHKHTLLVRAEWLRPIQKCFWNEEEVLNPVNVAQLFPPEA